jgi:hypothetical protein
MSKTTEVCAAIVANLQDELDMSLLNDHERHAVAEAAFNELDPFESTEEGPIKGLDASDLDSNCSPLVFEDLIKAWYGVVIGDDAVDGSAVATSSVPQGAEDNGDLRRNLD